MITKNTFKTILMLTFMVYRYLQVMDLTLLKTLISALLSSLKKNKNGNLGLIQPNIYQKILILTAESFQ